MYSYLHIAYAKPGYVADTSKNKICTRRMQEDVTPDSHGFTQKKTEVGASVHSHQSVAGVYLAPGLTQITLGKVLRKLQHQIRSNDEWNQAAN